MRAFGLPLLAIFSLLFASTLSAQTESLYVTDGDSSTIKAIQGGAITHENLAIGGDRRYRIAVRDTIWLGEIDAGPNAEFDLALTPTGATSPNGLAIVEGIDGASDGTFNYSVEAFYSSGGVYQFNADWTGGTLLFTVSGDNIVGISYDSSSSTLWISDRTTIYNYSMAGALLGSFPHAGGMGPLAYESTTDTLWQVSNSGGSTIRQYSKAGALLDTITVAYGGNVWGAEMGDSPPAAPAPGPGAYPVPSLPVPALALLALFILILGTHFSRRQRSS